MNKNKYVYEPMTGRNYRLDDGQEVNIGRAFDNDIIINDAAVSRHHASVGFKSGKIYVKDVRSTNGTIINGERISGDYAYELHELDEFQVGTLKLKLLDENSVIANNFKNRKMPSDTVIIYPGC